MSQVEEQLVKLYAEMAELTAPECAACPTPHSCCAPEHCEVTAQSASARWNITLPRVNQFKSTSGLVLPFMGEHGCTVAPHLRPICTIHTCAIQSMGFKRGDSEWTDKYFALRKTLALLEYKRNESV